MKAQNMVDRIVAFSIAVAFCTLSCAAQEPAAPKSHHIGQFEKAGEYMKDFFFLKAEADV